MKQMQMHDIFKSPYLRNKEILQVSLTFLAQQIFW
jgi:hypothetical protein